MAAIEKIATLPEGEVQKLQFFLGTAVTLPEIHDDFLKSDIFILICCGWKAKGDSWNDGRLCLQPFPIHNLCEGDQLIGLCSDPFVGWSEISKGSQVFLDRYKICASIFPQIVSRHRFSKLPVQGPKLLVKGSWQKGAPAEVPVLVPIFESFGEIGLDGI